MQDCAHNKKQRARRVAIKNILKKRAVRGGVTFLMSLMLRMIFLTARVEKIHAEAAQPFMDGKQQGIFCFWHGNMIMHPFFKPKRRPMAVLISHHRDGALITSVLGWLGIGTVRGSSRKGGANAMRELFAACEKGINIAITPDGPRGPLHHVAGGALMLAKHTELPLIPVAFAAACGKEFASWDRFFLPYFFTRIVFVAGDPIRINDAEDDFGKKLQSSLMQCLQRAQDAVHLRSS